MELGIRERGPPGAPPPGAQQQHFAPGTPGPQPPQPLPPQLFTTAASLLELTDKKLIVTLRDGRRLLGVLRSWDQYGNLVLTQTVERTILAGAGAFADEDRGLYLVRGENVILMGEIDLDKDGPPPGLEQIEPARMHGLRRAAEQASKAKNVARARRLKAAGLEEEHRDEAIF